MPRYERTTNVDASAGALFAFLSDIGNLPKYFDRMTGAEPGDGNEVRVTANVEGRSVEGAAWFDIDERAKTLAWGSEGPNDYHGELYVTGDGRSSQVTVRLFTEIDDGRIVQGLEQTLANIKRLVEASQDDLFPSAVTGTGADLEAAM